MGRPAGQDSVPHSGLLSTRVSVDDPSVQRASASPFAAGGDAGARASVRRRQRELGSVANALRMLELLARTPEAGVTELARSLAISKASVDRLLTTLVGAGFVEQNADTRRYRLSFKIAVLAEGVRSRMGIVEIARPYLRRLAERVHEGVNLGLFLDGALVYADTIPSTQPFRIEPRPGIALEPYATGAGKALLAFMAPDAREAYLAGLSPVAHTSTTLTSVPAIRAELERIRHDGHAFDRGERIEEAWCVAAPVLGRDGVAVAAVSVTATRSHFEAKREALVTAVRATAAEIGVRVAAAGGWERP